MENRNSTAHAFRMGRGVCSAALQRGMFCFPPWQFRNKLAVLFRGASLKARERCMPAVIRRTECSTAPRARLAAWLILACLVAARAAADNPWEKPWTQWTKGECEQVIEASSVSLQIREIHPAIELTAVYRVGDPLIRVVVQWSTAITRRQANLRLKILSGEIAEARAKEELGQTREHIILQLVLLSNNNLHFRDAAALEKKAQSSAYLLLSKSKTKIPAVKAEVVPRRAMGDPTFVRLYFPRVLDGNSSIGAGEKEVVLVWPELVVSFHALEAKFEVKKLAADPANEL